MPDPDDLNAYIWTRSSPDPGRVYPILLVGQFARGGLAMRGLLMRPEGWTEAVAAGWVRAIKPLPRSSKAPPLSKAPPWARN